jgi:hypothetical protein
MRRLMFFACKLDGSGITFSAVPMGVLDKCFDFTAIFDWNGCRDFQFGKFDSISDPNVESNSILFTKTIFTKKRDAPIS